MQIINKRIFESFETSDLNFRFRHISNSYQKLFLFKYHEYIKKNRKDYSYTTSYIQCKKFRVLIKSFELIFTEKIISS